ncbi:YdbL family protein [Novosphingobium album (ex Hu et al. 2023)]|uniref:YdbL family protein n=1 Tax=Novosphingobium album (ex Hu et al. 2023) TaxID=2930093 RepID=A0ABT0AWJ4_9SPHN|nr:YdbL family protein [Novosphingobium album (ex Hu et al. 2023)]MCJ2177046.1 YdbL family protein [Novosphingobium album (ex Hu et al. 2023)]
MTRLSIKSFKAAGMAVAAALLATGGIAVHAEGRSPEYAAARAAGQVGEQQDGYLGVVGSQSQAVVAMVRDLNNKRRAVYTDGAAASKSTVQEYATATACRLLADTKPGEKYQAPDGSWQTRGASLPLRPSGCK